MLWSRKTPMPIHDRSRLVGIDMTATRARAVAGDPGKLRGLMLDSAREELLLAIRFDSRTPQVGSAAHSVCRTLPHAVCSAFLAHIGQPKVWQAGRYRMTAESALGVILQQMAGPVAGETDFAALSLPAYVTARQANTLGELAQAARLPIQGTASIPLALAAHRAETLLQPASNLTYTPAEPDPNGDRTDWLVPLRKSDMAQSSVVVVDVDDNALSVAVVGVDYDEVRLVGLGVVDKLAINCWMDRLIDGISDRCVRICRRDPRDSAEAEQSLYEQLPQAIDFASRGYPSAFSLRTHHWYQDLTFRPEELFSFVAPLAKSTAERFRSVVAEAPLAVPPQAVWLTPSAARLPGVGSAVHAHTPEQTRVEVLPEAAVAVATAELAARWRAGTLPRNHLEAFLPLAKNPFHDAAARPTARV